MATATVTSKGQLTIPVEVRNDLNIRTGTRIEFHKRDDGSYEFIPITGSVMDLIGIITWDGPALTREEMDEGIAEAVAERDRRSKSGYSE